MAFDDAVHQRLHLRQIGDIAAGNLAEAALALDDLLRFLGGGEIDIDADDNRALARGQGGDGLAIAPAGTAGTAAGDQRHLAFQTEHSSVFPSFPDQSCAWPCARRFISRSGV